MINDFEKADPDIGVREHFKDGTTMVSEIHAVLLANHGPVVAGADLSDAVYAIEELEETAKLSPCCKANKAGRSAAMRRRNWKLASRGVCDIRRASPRF
ncbi:class II aldolase/adducin family protein [Rhizobium wenxiniae]|uniref:class II aldolase/adducin family protein n=1 Tax=Rhizobium wenxiniae TaxID=1737357 RepID=UPI003D32924C